jgi:hypothetical protein
MSHLTVTNRHGTNYLIWLLQADIVPELAPCYESEDETMGRRNKVASDLHLQRNKRGTRLYSKDDFREHYCITNKQLDVLERARGSGLFGCLSNYHVSYAYSSHCTNTAAKVRSSRVLHYKHIHEQCSTLASSWTLCGPWEFHCCRPLCSHGIVWIKMYCKKITHERCCISRT